LLFYFERWGIATLSTPLLTGTEKEVQEVWGVSPGEEVAQPASKGSVTPQLRTSGSGDASHSAQVCIPCESQQASTSS